MNTIQEQLASIEAATKSGNYAEAEAICRESLKYNITIEDRKTILLQLIQLLLQANKAQEAVPLLKETLATAEQTKDKVTEMKVYGHLSTAYRILSSYSQSLEAAEQYLALSIETSDQFHTASALMNIAIVYSSLGDYKKGLEYFNKALSITEAINDTLGSAKIISNIGQVYHHLAEYSLALEYYQRALSTEKEYGNSISMANTYSKIAKVYSNLADYQKAIEYLNQALDLFQEAKNTSGIASTHGTLGTIHVYLGDYSRALQYFENALLNARLLGTKNSEAIHLSNIAKVYEETKEYHQSLEYFQQSLDLFLAIGDKRGIAHNYLGMGTIYLFISDFSQALSYVQESLQLHLQLGDKAGVATCNGTIGLVYANKEYEGYSPEIAENYLLQTINTFEEVGKLKSLYQIYLSLSNLYEQTNRFELAYLYFKKFYELEKEIQAESVKKQADKFAFERQIALMEREREVTDMLLYKFLPSPIVPEVKEKEGRIVVQHFPSVSVLFADIAGFTQLSLHIKPEILIETLNFIFTKFDTIIKEAGGHRLRTIGDGYFAICGAPDLIENHQYKLAKAALKFMEDIILPKHIKQELPEGTILDIRIGLHCGEAVCGMVGGLEKWQYDAYGDTINTASRMESHGEAGKIHISEDFKNSLLDYDEFTFLPREPMFIKGKGMMNTYFLQ